MATWLDLSVAEGISLKWFLVGFGVVLWHIAVSDVARRRTSPRTESFYRVVHAVADTALVLVSLFGLVFLLLAIVVSEGAGCT
jgi:hypothetical protein